MKICIIVDDYMPTSIKVAAKMMHELAVEFVAQGHAVTVVTPDPSLTERRSISHLDGVTVCRFRSGEIKNVGKVKRAINETLLSFQAWFACRDYFRKNPHDLLIYYSPTIFWGWLVRKLKKLWDVPSYLILRDFFPQWVIDGGMLRESSPITKYFRFFEWLNYRSADTIAIQSPKNIEWFSRTASVKKPLDLLYNWAANTPVPHGGTAYRRELGLEGKVVYFYGGNIGHAQDMMNIVRLAKAMEDEPRAHFVLLGAGDEVELVRDAIDQLSLSNMTLLPAVSQEEFKNILAEFDVGLFSLHRDHVTHNFPGKLLGYMVQQKPILGSVNPGNDLQDVVETAGAGLVSVNGDDAALLANALRLLHDDAFRSGAGANAGQLLMDTFSVEAATRHILRSLNRH
jgi:O26-antigen biosynthesis N-acetyl-L-fucosamine transferase